MTITIHQPEHFPYYGFLDKVNKSDIFVILDDVQFKKNNFQNRNQILTLNGPKWIGIPVEMKHITNKYINDRKVQDNWKEEYLNKIIETYKKHPYFDENIDWIERVLSLQSNKLIDYNIGILEKIFDIKNIKTEIIYSSELQIETVKTQRLFDICSKLNATDYLAGQGAIDYLDTKIFSNVNILKHEFIHPLYEQYNSTQFVPYMSSLDFLMNIGKDNLSGLLHE